MFDNERIEKEYIRNLNLTSDESFGSDKFITYEEVFKAHFLVIDFLSTTTENIVNRWR